MSRRSTSFPGEILKVSMPFDVGLLGFSYAEKSFHCAGHCFTAEADNKLRVRESTNLTENIFKGSSKGVRYENEFKERSRCSYVLGRPYRAILDYHYLTTTRSAISRLSARSSCPRQYPAFRARILSRHGPIRSITDRFIAFRELPSD